MKIVVTGVKGGVGKSTIAYSMLKEIAEEGKVLFVDMDYTLTISNLLGATKPTRLGNIIVIPYSLNSEDGYKLEDYRREVNVEIVDVPSQLLKHYFRTFGGMKSRDAVVLVTSEVPYVLTTTVEYGKLLKSQYNVNNVILTVNMVKGEIRYFNEFPTIKVPFSYSLLYKGVSAAPSFIKIWKDIKNFLY